MRGDAHGSDTRPNAFGLAERKNGAKPLMPKKLARQMTKALTERIELLMKLRP